MRRFVTLGFLLFFTVSFGISISGCAKKNAVVFCSEDSGPVVGQVQTISLTPTIFGVSLNYAEIGSVGSPTAKDCKGETVSVGAFTYGTVNANLKPDMTIADVQPTTGRLCAGTWNRNTGGGIPDYTTCVPNNKTGTAYVIVSGGGASSNPLPVYVHPVVTSILLGPLSTDCLHDPATNCSPAAFINSQTSCTIDAGTGCCTVPVTTTTAPLNIANGCVSQGVTGQLAARAFAGTGTTQTNISCQVGHLSYTAQTESVVSIDPNGVATAVQPGSTTINANVSTAGSSAGFFSTCPPTSIKLSVPPGTGTSVSMNPNNTQPIAATVVDMNGTVLTGLSLEFMSTTPTTIPAGNGSVTPLLPGTASITAVCQPPGCNPSPFNQIGLFGNGKPVTSNPVTVTAPGTSSTVLYIGSTKSLYVVPVDFTTQSVGSPVRLPYVPNSMVISNDGLSVYLGSSVELMAFNAVSNSVTTQDPSVPGKVLTVSPDNGTLVISDPVRKQVYLYSTSGGVQTTYGGVATHAQFTPDSSAVYITMGDVDASGNVTPNNQLLVYSKFTGWSKIALGAPAADVAVAVPSVGAYLAGSPTTARSYCPSTTASANGQTILSNELYPLADTATVATDRVVATNDGRHILGATVAGGPAIVDLGFKQTAPAGLPVGACPVTVPPNYFTGQRTSTTTVPLSGVTATAINGIVPTSDSAVAFVTYTGSGKLPAYAPATGTVTYITLSGATAPVSGVLSSDNLTFYVGTSGDNLVHLVNPKTLTDDATKTIAPKLPDAGGNLVAPDLLVQRPRKSVS